MNEIQSDCVLDYVPDSIEAAYQTGGCRERQLTVEYLQDLSSSLRGWSGLVAEALADAAHKIQRGEHWGKDNAL